MALNGKQRRALRALGHHLNPVIHIGKEGVTETLLEATNAALETHELIKLKVGDASPLDRHDAADELAAKAKAEVAQVLGRTILLYRRRAKDPEIGLPGMPLPPKEKQAPKPTFKKAAPKKRSRRTHD